MNNRHKQIIKIVALAIIFLAFTFVCYQYYFYKYPQNRTLGEACPFFTESVLVDKGRGPDSFMAFFGQIVYPKIECQPLEPFRKVFAIINKSTP